MTEPTRRDLTKRGTEAGIAVGAASMGGGIPGALLAAGARELLARALGARERRRIETVCQEAAQRYAAALAEGRTLRDDEFFSTPEGWKQSIAAPWGTLAPPAGEVIEALLLQAGRTYEERKLPFITQMLVELLFRDDVDASSAHQLQRFAQDLSWRQYVLLSLFYSPRSGDWTHEVDVPADHHSGVPQDLEQLASLGLLGAHEPGGDSYPLDSVAGMGLGFMGVTARGRLLCEMLGLRLVPEREYDELLAGLQ